jgi:DNA helicase-2/ATP-dependent DNA helicase PcrA
VHANWQHALPSRFIEELPEDHVEVEAMSTSYGGYGLGTYGASRFDEVTPFANSYATPGWQRAKKAYAEGRGLRSSPRIIEGELVARETGGGEGLAVGERIFHQKFGYGRVSRIDGNKLTIDFDKAGEKRVIDSFVERA